MVAILMVVGLLLTAGPASAWGDTSMPHFGRDVACSDHMVNPTSLGSPGLKTFYLCKLNSGATQWSFTIVRNSVPPVNVCTMSYRDATATLAYQCPNSLNSGSYKGTISYYINGSPFVGHADYWWTIQ